MSGTYKCVTQHGGREYVHTHNLHVYDPLSFFNTDEVQHILEGDNSKVNCEVLSDSTPIIGWYKDDVEISRFADKYKVEPGGLRIYNVTKQDAGTYRCNVLAEETSEEIDKYIKVEVWTMPVIANLEAIPDKFVIVGEKVIVECKAEGSPEPKYQWNKKLPPEVNVTENWIQEENRIVFSEIQSDAAGTYECVVDNGVGNYSMEITIEVLSPPTVTGFPNRTEVEGSLVSIFCNATGKPEPNITITFESSMDKNNWDSPQEISNGNFIRIERSHEGVYICNASNEINYDTKYMYLTVKHKPYFDNPEEEIWGWNDKTITISCEHDSNPTSFRNWTFQGPRLQDEQLLLGKRLIEQLTNIPENYLTVTIDKNFPYGTFRCDVKNVYGEATKTIKIKQAFTPPPITNTSLVEVTATSATFSIGVPITFEGPPVVGYKAEYDSIENYEITSVHEDRYWAIDRPYKLTKLKPNTTYSIKFAAINEVGAGDWSNYMDFHTLEKSAPEPPIWDETSPNGNLELKWEAPESNGEPIDYYSIRYCPINENLQKETENWSACVEKRLELTTKLDLTKLGSNMTYYLELIAHNAEGNSTSATITVTIPETQVTEPFLSAGVIIGIAVVVALICLFLLDLLFLFWRQQGILASCFLKKNKKKKDATLNIRDKKGLLKDGGDSTDTLRRPNNGHKEYEYNKSTGVITGKHSSV